MDILNFISWIRGGRQVTSVDPDKTLLPIGIKDSRRDDGYLAAAITVTDLANYICGGGNCCSNETTVTLSYTPEYTSFGGIILQLYCNGEKVSEGGLDKITTSLTETIDWLNLAYGSTNPLYLPLLGTFSLSGGDTVLLTLTECQYKRLCPEGELTFGIISFP